jgi:hypothetical protein
MSLSPLFDITSATDFVRALLKLLDDWEAAIVEGGKGVVRPVLPSSLAPS